MSENKTSIKTKLIAVVCVVGFVLFCGWCYTFVGGMTYSEGDRVGVVTKFSKKGVFYKTWEGELNMAVPGTVTDPSETIWYFSAEDPEAVEQIKKAQEAASRVKVHYKQSMWKQSWRGKTDYFAVSVSPVGQ